MINSFLMNLSAVTVSAIDGSVSGIPVIADSGKKKILLLKGKKPETAVSFSLLPLLFLNRCSFSSLLTVSFYAL